MENVVFDTARAEDIPELVRLRIAYMLDDFGSITEYEEACMRRQLPEYFSRKLGTELIAFVARAEGRLVAAAYLLLEEKPSSPFRPNGLGGEVLSVYTEDAYRGQGICTQLMKNMVEYGREHKMDRIDLVATKEGEPIYRKIGFVDNRTKYTPLKYELR